MPCLYSDFLHQHEFGVRANYTALLFYVKCLYCTEHKDYSNSSSERENDLPMVSVTIIIWTESKFTLSLRMSLSIRVASRCCFTEACGAWCQTAGMLLEAVGSLKQIVVNTAFIFSSYFLSLHHFCVLFGRHSTEYQTCNCCWSWVGE